MQYRINEIFRSIQGEGARAGSVNVFVRFAGCNLQCNVEEHGFDCDTDFSGSMAMDEGELCKAIRETAHGLPYIIWTGGEPSLQLNDTLIAALPEFYHAIETNGTNELPERLDWVSVSPKSAEHTLRVKNHINELRYVRGKLQALPKPRLKADHYYVSPAFHPSGVPDLGAVRWCQELVMENPTWKLSLQTHKLLSPIR